MIGDHFTIRGTNTKTGRRKKIYTSAYSENEAIEFAREQGLVEPFEITRETPEPTEAQLEYAKDLGARVPKNATREDLRAIITKQLDGGGEPSNDLKRFADSRGILYSRYVGKVELYNTIFRELSSRDRIAFFILCVYRWVSDDRQIDFDNHPFKSTFESFADKMENNERFVKSMSGYRGEDIRFFGRIISENGWESDGGSVNTIAYREACQFLANELNINVSRKTKNFSRNSSRKENTELPEFSEESKQIMNGCGCLILLAIVALIYFL